MTISWFLGTRHHRKESFNRKIILVYGFLSNIYIAFIKINVFVL